MNFISKRERVSLCWCRKPYTRKTGMLTSDGHALVTNIQDRLIELYVQQKEARRTEDRGRAHELHVETDKATAQREEIHRGSTLGST